MPAPATKMASHVLAGSFLPRKNRENKAVIIGPIAIVTSTLATVVKVRASIKAVNITAQQAPDSQTARPDCSKPRHKAGPRISVSAPTKASALKALRQKVTSKLRATSSWRVTTPAILHSKVTSTISATARR